MKNDTQYKNQQMQVIRKNDYHGKPSYTLVKCDVLDQSGEGSPAGERSRAHVWAHVKNGSPEEISFDREGKNSDAAIEEIIRQMFPDVNNAGVSIDFLATFMRDNSNGYKAECRTMYRSPTGNVRAETRVYHNSRSGATFMAMMQSFDIMRQYLNAQEEKHIPTDTIHS